ncbi:MAG TPA: hypothetical protein VNJ02_19575 [Vicinamibacterales bacterium]|nr:hypothetical protein [Vicinamibacterales bacterium]
MSRHITHFRRTALGATAPFACTALAACGATTESRRRARAAAWAE